MIDDNRRNFFFPKLLSKINVNKHFKSLGIYLHLMAIIFKRLSTSFIHSFKNFKIAFLYQFANRKKYQKNAF